MAKRDSSGRALHLDHGKMGRPSTCETASRNGSSSERLGGSRPRTSSFGGQGQGHPNPEKLPVRVSAPSRKRIGSASDGPGQAAERLQVGVPDEDGAGG